MDAMTMESIKKALMTQPDNVLKTLFLLAEFLPKDYSVKIKMFGPSGPVECQGSVLVINHTVESDENRTPAVTLEKRINRLPDPDECIEKLKNLCDTFSAQSGHSCCEDDGEDNKDAYCFSDYFGKFYTFDTEEDMEEARLEYFAKFEGDCAEAAAVFEHITEDTNLSDAAAAQIAGAFLAFRRA